MDKCPLGEHGHQITDGMAIAMGNYYFTHGSGDDRRLNTHSLACLTLINSKSSCTIPPSLQPCSLINSSLVIIRPILRRTCRNDLCRLNQGWGSSSTSPAIAEKPPVRHKAWRMSHAQFLRELPHSNGHPHQWMISCDTA